MTTTADLIHETKRYLLSSHREVLNTLNDVISDITTTTISFNHTTAAIAPGAYLSVDLEIMYVWSIGTSGNTATVERGMLGSEAATHATGALVTVNPKFPDFSVLSAINSDLHDLNGQGLYSATTKTFTYIAGRQGYELDVDNVIVGLDMHYDYPGITHDWPRLSLWEISREVDSTDFPSGFSVQMREPAYSGRNVRVTVGVPYAPLSGLSDDVEAVSGLQPSAHDLPPLGAALRLQGVREGSRNFHEAQPDSRRSSEVDTGAQLTSTRGLLDFRRARILSELRTLNRLYPTRRFVA